MFDQQAPQAEQEPTPQEEAEMDWAEKLDRARVREQFMRALRNRRSSRIVNHRFRAAVLTRRLLDPNPRDKREERNQTHDHQN